MDWHSVRVLMWKHLAVRLRRYIHTVVEFLSPIALVVILASSGIFGSAPPDHIQSQIYYPDKYSINEFQNIRCIYYYPATNLMKTLMSEVGPKLKIMKTDCKGTYNVGYCPVQNESFFDQLSTVLTPKEAVVIFNDMSGTEWPKKLDYTIRMKGDFETDLIYPKDGRHEPRYNFGSEYKIFTAIQWAIDTSFIKVMTGTEIGLDNVSTQEFPYYSMANRDSSINSFIVGFCQLSLLLVFVFLMSRLLNERATGIQELMKMVGVSNGSLVLTHFLNVLPGGLLYAIVTPALAVASLGFFQSSATGVLLAFGLFLHFVSLVGAAFVCSFLVKSTQYVVSISVLAYGVMAYPVFQLRGLQIPGNWRLLTGLLPHVPFMWLVDEAAAIDHLYGYIPASSIFNSHTNSSYSILVSYVMVLVQTMLFFLLNWYLSLVRPGKYGQALPCNFLFKKQYWMRNEIRPKLYTDAEEETPIVTDKKYFEEPPKNLEVGIKICNVSKVFPSQKALENVSLDVYKGEITVLLGHNGAGKTTLMSIITGMMSATEGKVYVNGMETVSQQREVRKHLGLCPQHNLFFPDLTVIEHVKFFTMLRGKSFSEAKTSSMGLLQQLGIADKADNKSSELSGGMMRRLQLACALAGDADVLILDEPTSGLDVETRRSLWDLLLNVCGSRTVLLSTHFMEEADALGHRAAALHHGRLRCHASTMYLKKAIGTGYRLSFTTICLPNETAITQSITSFIPEVTIKEKSLNSLSYGLPAASSSKFPQLFLQLESNRSKLGIDSIGVGISTLEEVFLKLCSDVDTTFGETRDNNDIEYTEPQSKKLTGFPLYLRQFFVLFKRQFYYLMSKKLSFLLLQVLIPIVVIGVITHSLNSEQKTESDHGAPMTLDLYKDIDDVRVLYNINKDGADIQTIIDAYPKIIFEKNNDIAETIAKYSKDDPAKYAKYLLGVELNSTTAKILYTTTLRHAAPVAVNVLSNVVADMYLPRSAGRSIAAVNKPVVRERPQTEPPVVKANTGLYAAIAWIFFVVFIILSTNVNAVSLPCKERVSGARHTHVMSGCPPELYWTTTLLFHTLVCTLVLIAPTLIMGAVIERDHVIDQPEFLLILFLILELTVLAFFALIYLVSFQFNETGSGVFLSAFIIIFGIFTPLISVAFTMFVEEKGAMYYIMSIFNYIVPPQTAIMAGVMAAMRAANNALCNMDKSFCSVAIEKPELVLNGIDPTCYLCFNELTPARFIIALVVQFAVLITLVFLSERGYLNGWFDLLMNRAYRPPPAAPAPDLVRAEAAYVTKAITLPPNQIKDVLLADNLHKRYPKIFTKSCNAVKGVSFSIKKGECFGLLGVNGAGKSTTFKMLTAEECATRGNIFANGYHRNRNVGPYIRSLGYCPQFFGLDEFQTGAQNLALLLTLRGLDVVDVTNEVTSWIKIVGLEKYMHRRVSGYSGGCKRRLGAGAALAAGAPLTALDEPTAGVDVAARRRVWTALRRALRADRAVLISSHSMDEMDALCSSIAIMSDGEIRALGSGAALRAAHAAGHALLLKIKHSSTSGDEVDGAKAEVDRLKGTLHQSFDCTLKDEHRTMLHYHINETMKYSDLFTQLEELKNNFSGVVEDYSVTETTLEEVFLSFAKGNHGATV